MTQTELIFLNKVSSQILNYAQIGFDQYGIRVGVQQNPLVDVLENSISDRNITTLNVGKLLAGTISVGMDIGSGNVKIDGANTRILINDGSNDRVLIGYLAGKF